MKLGVLRRISREDLSKAGNVPSWLDYLLTPINQFFDSVFIALAGNLTFADNFACKQYTLKFENDTALEVGTGQRRALGVLPLYANGNTIDSWGSERKTNGNLSVTFTFGTPQQTEVTFIIFFEG